MKKLLLALPVLVVLGTQANFTDFVKQLVIKGLSKPNVYICFKGDLSGVARGSQAEITTKINSITGPVNVTKNLMNDVKAAAVKIKTTVLNFFKTGEKDTTKFTTEQMTERKLIKYQTQDIKHGDTAAQACLTDNLKSLKSGHIISIVKLDSTGMYKISYVAEITTNKKGDLTFKKPIYATQTLSH